LEIPALDRRMELHKAATGVSIVPGSGAVQGDYLSARESATGGRAMIVTTHSLANGGRQLTSRQVDCSG